MGRDRCDPPAECDAGLSTDGAGLSGKILVWEWNDSAFGLTATQIVHQNQYTTLGWSTSDVEAETWSGTPGDSTDRSSLSGYSLVYIVMSAGNPPMGGHTYPDLWAELPGFVATTGTRLIVMGVGLTSVIEDPVNDLMVDVGS